MLVLVGSTADDDLEAAAVLESVQASVSERDLVLSVTDQLFVNALQRRAAVILQKSIREGFGLTVSEAMWKGTPVIGGNVGGFRYQITHGENGFLINNIGEAGARIVTLLQNPGLRRRMGASGRQATSSAPVQHCAISSCAQSFGPWSEFLRECDACGIYHSEHNLWKSHAGKCARAARLTLRGTYAQCYIRSASSCRRRFRWITGISCPFGNSTQASGQAR